MIVKRTFKAIFLMAFTGFILSSCGEDSIVGALDPTLAFSASTGADQTVKPSEVVKVTITATKGDNELNGIEVKEDGVKVNSDRLTFKGAAVGGNPILLLGTDRQGFTAELTIKASASSGQKSVTITVLDATSKSATVTKKITTEATPPTMKYNGPNPVENVSTNTTNLFNFDVTKGSGKIASIEVQENGVKIADVTRLDFNGVKFTTNPETVTGTSVDGFVGKSVGIKTPATAGTYEYTFVFTDEFGLKVESKVTAKVGTLLSFSATGVLFNAAGPAGTGGLDLDTGEGTGSSDTKSEIKDLGIDSGAPVATNWLQKIQGINGTELKVAAPGTDFTKIVFTEQILSLWTNGTAVSGATAKVGKGNQYVAKRGTTYYFFEVADVIATTNDNQDKYELNIKH